MKILMWEQTDHWDRIEIQQDPEMTQGFKGIFLSAKMAFQLSWENMGYFYKWSWTNG